MATKIVERTNTDDDFYTLLGPFLANRTVHAALGGPPFDDDTKTWFIALNDGDVVGFAAVNAHRNRWTLESLYLVEGNNRLAARLVAAAAKRFAAAPLQATVRPTLVDAYTRAGFAPVKTLANYVQLARPATEQA